MESDHEGSLGSDAMEEELDEDIYGTQDTKQNGIKADPDAKPLPADAMKTEDSDEDDDDEDSVCMPSSVANAYKSGLCLCTSHAPCPFARALNHAAYVMHLESDVHPYRIWIS